MFVNCQMNSEDTLRFAFFLQIVKALQIIWNICNSEVIVLYSIIYSLYIN